MQFIQHFQNEEIRITFNSLSSLSIYQMSNGQITC